MKLNFKQVLVIIILLLSYHRLSAQPKVLTALKSAVVPGWGELSKGNSSGFIFLSSEIALWSTFFYFNHESDLKIKQSEQFAFNKANLNNFNIDNQYWLLMEKYNSSGFESGGYNESVVKKALELYPANPQMQTEYILNNKLDDSVQWDWKSRDIRKKYQIMRKDSAHYDDYAKAVTGAIIVNHMISFFNAMRVANREPKIYFSTSFDKDFTPYLNCRVSF